MNVTLDHIAAAFGCSLDDAHRICEHWSPEPLMRGDRLIGLGMRRGCEIHFACLPEFYGSVLSRGAAHAYFSKLLENLQYVTTKVPRINEFEKRFVKAMGFTQSWEDESFVYYIMTEPPFKPRGAEKEKENV